ncbi:MAG: hypothetical protein ING36_14605 [Burkholderiales bacterium]|jgi:hypothetical protein|nr:hypothetical protein [Burkholderiales bacterium]
MRVWLVIVLVVTLMAAWFAPEDDDLDLAAARNSALPENSSQSGSILHIKDGHATQTQVRVLEIRDRVEYEELSLFSEATWGRAANNPAVSAPPITSVAEAVPAAPSAPPLPFRLMGRYEDAGKSVVFLLQADKSWAVSEGDTFSSYKVEHITANAVHVRYLPLNETQILDVSSTP